MAARVIPSREIFSITIRADGCVSLGSPRFSAPHFPSCSHSFCPASPCPALPFLLPLPFSAGFAPFSARLFALRSPFSSLLFSSFLFCFFAAFQARQTVAISFHFVALPAARSLLTNCCCTPHVFGLCFGAASSGAATLQVSLYSRPDLKAPSASGHLLARNAQLISACAAPPSNCI